MADNRATKHEQMSDIFSVKCTESDEWKYLASIRRHAVNIAADFQIDSPSRRDLRADTLRTAVGRDKISPPLPATNAGIMELYGSVERI